MEVRNTGVILCFSLSFGVHISFFFAGASGNRISICIGLEYLVYFSFLWGQLFQVWLRILVVALFFLTLFLLSSVCFSAHHFPLFTHLLMKDSFLAAPHSLPAFAFLRILGSSSVYQTRPLGGLH